MNNGLRLQMYGSKGISMMAEKFIKELHLTLKSGTSDSRKDWFAAGDYKKLPNEVGGMDTALPEEVASKMKALLTTYNVKEDLKYNIVILTFEDNGFLLVTFDFALFDEFFFLCSDTFQKSRSWLIIWILWNKLSTDSKIEDF